MDLFIASIPVMNPVLYAVAVSVASYGLFIALLTVPYIQNQVIYLNSIKLTWGLDINIPEQWGFLRRLPSFHYPQSLLHAALM